MPTNVKVRVQARGGKYLGPALAGDPPLLTVSWPGRSLGPVSFPTGSSGEVYSTNPNSGAPFPPATGVSPYTIEVTDDPSNQGYVPGTYLLAEQTTPPAPQGTLTDSYLIVALDLAQGDTAVTFTVQAFSPQPVTSSVTKTLTAGQDYTAEPGVVVLVDGLRVTNVAAYATGQNTQVTANVAMMCGCMVTPSKRPAGVKEPYWPAYEFEVFAEIAGSIVPMICMGPSTFTGPGPSVPPGTPVSVNARQMKTGNGNTVSTLVVPAFSLGG